MVMRLFSGSDGGLEVGGCCGLGEGAGGGVDTLFDAMGKGWRWGRGRKEGSGRWRGRRGWGVGKDGCMRGMWDVGVGTSVGRVGGRDTRGACVCVCE